MRLPQELAMLVGSYLDPRDLRVCTTQLCSSETEFVSAGFTNDDTTIILHELVACVVTHTEIANKRGESNDLVQTFSRIAAGLLSGVRASFEEMISFLRSKPRNRLSAGGDDDVAQKCIERIESFVARRRNVRTIILDSRLSDEHASNGSVYSEIHRRLQQGYSFQLSQHQEITVEWHVRAESIAQVKFLLKVPKDGACVSDSPARGAVQQYLHTLNLWNIDVTDLSMLSSCQYLHTLILDHATQVSDVSALASCKSLQTLSLVETQVSDVSALASCKSLRTLNLSQTQVNDVSALASCQSLYALDLSNTKVIDITPLASCKSLHELDLYNTQVSDVSELASCKSLHELDLHRTQVSDVSTLASCQSLHMLTLFDTQVSDVSALASCQSLHQLDLRGSKVVDVSALASCQSLRTLWGVEGMIGGRDVLRDIQGRG
jgi:hypothetical protein